MTELPTGAVTLLFTDIEGSTRLLQKLGRERYIRALSDQRRIVREAFTRHGGVEVEMQGDSFHFAFAQAHDAVEAAAAAQQALAEHDWEAEPIRIRIGIHTGEPVPHEGLYAGLDVHRAARIMSAGYGGQVLVSETTRALLDSAFELRDIGEHRLKDFEEAVSIFQLGNESFPPLKSISNTNLPRPANSFVGRERELEELVAHLRARVRLVSLTGPGGSGKTRLALEAAATVVPEYRSGVFWVGLAPLRDPALVLETISQTLGAKNGLAEHIGDRELLLLLDNLEQVIEAAPELGQLLHSCPNLTMLVTSRELLRVQGEVEYAVPPLAEPDAVRLFCERAQLDPTVEIAELCARLDSLPLAVELAAARTTALSPGQILDRLSDRLDVFKGGRDADPRQQTLRATIAWSYELLPEKERTLFARLSVFAGGTTLEGAEEVAGADLDDLQSLVEKSLLRFTKSRYWMLETIREYAIERLVASGELQALKARHAEYVLRLASRLEDAFGSSDERTGFQSEQNDFRAALDWAEEASETELQLELIGRSWPFWWYRGHPAEGLRWVEAALAGHEGERGERQAKVLAAGAMFAYRLGEVEAIRTYASESLAIARELDDARHTVWPLIFLGLAASEAGDYDEATRIYEEATDVARETGERKLLGVVANNLGVVAMNQGDYDRAASQFEEALTISRKLRTPDETALETINYAWCLHHTGRADEAAKAAKEGVALSHQVENLSSLVDGLVLSAALVCRRGDSEAAARLLGAADGIRDSVGDVQSGADKDLAVTVEEVMLALGDEAYARAFGEGRRTSVDQAVEHALAGVGA